jgi:tetratricopeptide (TPR) repeat protein
MRAQVRSDLQNYPGALQDFDRSIQLNPMDPSAFRQRAWTRWETKDLQGAIDDFTAAISRTEPSERAAIICARGNVEVSVHDYTSAMRDYAGSLSANPEFSLAYKYRAKLKNRLGDNTGAVVDYLTYICFERKRDLEQWIQRSRDMLFD